MNHKIYLSLFLLLISYGIKAQISSPVLHSNKNQDTSKTSPTQFSLHAGAFVMGNKQNAYYGSYVMPMVRLNSDKRFSYGFGASISTSNINSSFYNINSDLHSLSFQPRVRNTVFVFGSYKVNEKIMVSGSLYQEINPNSLSLKNPNTNFNNQANRGMNFNVIYKASENTSFQFDFNYSTGNQGFYPYNMNTRSNFNQVPSNYFFNY